MVGARLRLTVWLLLPMIALVAGCGGRDSWLNDPLPERPAVEPPAPLPDEAPRVRFTTSVGDFVVALYAERMPVTVTNFLEYVDAGFYDRTLVHRVERVSASAPAVIQAGGYDTELEVKSTREPIPLESSSDLSNVRGTLAMARAGDPDTATSQFFVNFLDNPGLDGDEARPGYAVFGVVVEGMDVVDRITMVPVAAVAGTRLSTAPMIDVIIERVRRE